jgi:hypothetical protein
MVTPVGAPLHCFRTQLDTSTVPQSPAVHVREALPEAYLMSYEAQVIVTGVPEAGVSGQTESVGHTVESFVQALVSTEPTYEPAVHSFLTLAPSASHRVASSALQFLSPKAPLAASVYWFAPVCVRSLPEPVQAVGVPVQVDTSSKNALAQAGAPPGL